MCMTTVRLGQNSRLIIAVKRNIFLDSKLLHSKGFTHYATCTFAIVAYKKTVFVCDISVRIINIQNLTSTLREILTYIKNPVNNFIKAAYSNKLQRNSKQNTEVK